ncbi:hypothetical protein V1525DRAFT_398634 [Lipomyces kononenkoae]|uniref:Uncharacterized protein n=1 Tax=Lipomyces kononenkoae TaxID=34357 RepID=A0ACC3T5X3_LIPKO
MALSATEPEAPDVRIVENNFFTSGPPCPLYDGVFEKTFDGRLPTMLAQSRSPSPAAFLLADPRVFATGPLRPVVPLSPKLRQACNQLKRREGTTMSLSLQHPRSSTPESLFDELRLSDTDRHLTQRQPSQADVNYGAVATRADPSTQKQKETESIEMEELKPVPADSREFAFPQSTRSVGHPKPMREGHGCASRVLQRQGQPEFLSVKKDALRRVENCGFKEFSTASKVRAMEGNRIDIVSEAENYTGKNVVVTSFDTMRLFGSFYGCSTDEDEFEPILESTLGFRNTAESTGVALHSNMSSSVLPVPSNRSNDESPLAIINSLERRPTIYSHHERDAIQADKADTRSRSYIEGTGNIVADEENNCPQVNGELNDNTVRVYTLLSTGPMQPPLQLDQLEPDIFGNEIAGLSVAVNGDNKDKRKILGIFKRKYSELVDNDSPNIRMSANLKSVRLLKWHLRVRKPQRVLASIEKRLDIFTKLFKSVNAHVKEQPGHLLLEDSSDLQDF